MRKVISFHHVSLDGYLSGPNGEMDWIVFDEQIQEYASDVHSTADTVLYGRATYEMMAGFWPKLPESLQGSRYHVEQARWLETATKFVCSTSLTEADWINSKVIKGHIPEELAALKRGDGKDMIVIGSASLSHYLIQNNLIDEYRINVNPVVLGAGVPLFKNISHRIDLKLVEAIPFKSGVVSLVYWGNAY
ncbi:MAG: dihydrofolate reductase [Paenibacillus sp.]|jgi:dihydrofolate reductase|nr:dihydrofolate reductase [Paenibacillus sp.]